MPEVSPSKYLVTATWDDVPHLSEEEKRRLWDGIPPHQRKSRAKGIPQLGVGLIYPVDEESITVDDFEVPEFWPKAYALDVGWKVTAALWGAWDRQNDCVYVWSVYSQTEKEPATHVDAIKARGYWIPGVIDPAARGRSQKDGVALLNEYVGMGLDLDLADNTVESGLFAVYRRMVSGRLKIFKTCFPLFAELSRYHRNERGEVVKENDHLCDCLRYLVVSGMALAVTQIVAEQDDHRNIATQRRNRVTGY